MLEAVVAVLDRKLGWSRRASVVVGASTCFVAGSTAWMSASSSSASWAPSEVVGRCKLLAGFGEDELEDPVQSGEFKNLL